MTSRLVERWFRKQGDDLVRMNRIFDVGRRRLCASDTSYSAIIIVCSVAAKTILSNTCLLVAQGLPGGPQDDKLVAS